MEEFFYYNHERYEVNPEKIMRLYGMSESDIKAVVENDNSNDWLRVRGAAVTGENLLPITHQTRYKNLTGYFIKIEESGRIRVYRPNGQGVKMRIDRHAKKENRKHDYACKIWRMQELVREVCFRVYARKPDVIAKLKNNELQIHHKFSGYVGSRLDEYIQNYEILTKEEHQERTRQLRAYDRALKEYFSPTSIYRDTWKKIEWDKIPEIGKIRIKETADIG